MLPARLFRPVLVVAVVGCVFSTVSCAPRARLAYPVSEADGPATMDEIVGRLSPRDRIRVQLADSDPMEATFRKREGDSLLVKKMHWKGQVIGKKLVEDDETTELAIADVEQLHVYRHSTLQKIGAGVLIAGGITGVILMVATEPE